MFYGFAILLLGSRLPGQLANWQNAHVRRQSAPVFSTVFIRGFGFSIDSIFTVSKHGTSQCLCQGPQPQAQGIVEWLGGARRRSLNPGAEEASVFDLP